MFCLSRWCRPSSAPGNAAPPDGSEMSEPLQLCFRRWRSTSRRFCRGSGGGGAASAAAPLRTSRAMRACAPQSSRHLGSTSRLPEAQPSRAAGSAWKSTVANQQRKAWALTRQVPSRLWQSKIACRKGALLRVPGKPSVQQQASWITQRMMLSPVVFQARITVQTWIPAKGVTKHTPEQLHRWRHSWTWAQMQPRYADVFWNNMAQPMPNRSCLLKGTSTAMQKCCTTMSSRGFLQRETVSPESASRDGRVEQPGVATAAPLIVQSTEEAPGTSASSATTLWSPSTAGSNLLHMRCVHTACLLAINAPQQSFQCTFKFS